MPARICAACRSAGGACAAARFLVILRDPVDRTVSSWKFKTAAGVERRPLRGESSGNFPRWLHALVPLAVLAETEAAVDRRLSALLGQLMLRPEDALAVTHPGFFDALT